MFRHFSLAIFRLINGKKLVSSYTRLACIVYNGEVRGEVGTRSRMCCVGWVVWVHSSLQRHNGDDEPYDYRKIKMWKTIRE